MPKRLMQQNPSGASPRSLAEATTFIEELRDVIKQQQEIIDGLNFEVQSLQRALFGNRRERVIGVESSSAQLFLFETLEAPAAPAQDAQAESSGSGNADCESGSCDADPGKVDAGAKKGRQRRIFPDNLPRERIDYSLPDSDATDEARRDGRVFFRPAGQRLHIREETIVQELFVETIALDNEDRTATELITASKPPRIVDCFVSDEVLARLACNRFCDHLPYYRLEEILLRSEVTIDRSTQSRWMGRIAAALKPLTNLMRERVLQCDVIQADETPVAKLEPSLGRTSKSYLWAILGTAPCPYITFSYTADRSAAGPDKFFQDFCGKLVADAYICYQRLSETTLGRVELSGCHVHARRKFEAVHNMGSTERTEKALDYFRRLFEMEDTWLPLTPEERLEKRQLFARPLMDEFKQWLEGLNKTLLPKHQLRAAVEYMLKRWNQFTRFLEDGRIPVHNNASEQAVKLPVIGKKNWLHFGNDRAGETAATLFTLTATCRELHINPVRYFEGIFACLPTIDCSRPHLLEPLLPDKWLADHPEAFVDLRHREEQQRAARKRKERRQRHEQAGVA